MEIKEIIAKEFDDYVEKTFKNESIKSFLKNHPRRHLLARNLKQQIDEDAFGMLYFNRNIEDQRRIVEDVAKDFVKFFCKVALEVKEAEFTNNKVQIGGIINEEKDENNSNKI